MSQMRNFYLLILLVLCASSSIAQKGKSQISISAFPSAAYFTGTSLSGNFEQTTFAYGLEIGANYFVREKVSLASGVRYEQKGSGYDFPLTDAFGNPISSFAGATRMDYLILPLMVERYFGERQIFFVQLGTYVGYLMKSTFGYEATSQAPALNHDSRPDFAAFDVGISLGAGVQFSINERLSWNASLQTNHGLLNVSALPGDNKRLNSSQLVLGMNWNLMKTDK